MKHFIKVALVISIVLAARNLYGQSHGWTVNPADYNYNGTVTAVVFHGTSEVTTGTLGAFVGGTCRGFADGAFFPPTGKTVFIVMCYSDQVSGETMTFRYFDPTDNTYYDIKETVEFVSDMIIGDASAPLQYHTVPLVYSVTGGGSYCQGGSGLPVGLSGSEAGVTYTLYKNSVEQTHTVAGIGSAISFGNQLGGTYTVSGDNSGGTINMTGNAVIIENPNAVITLTSVPATNAQSICINTAITNITYSVTGGGTGAGVTGLPTGVNGVYNTGVFTISGTPTVSGTFNYTITTTGTCTQKTATGTIIVNALPTITGTLSFYLGSTTQLTGSGTPAVSSPWISSSPLVATVDNNGLVTSVSAGTSVITYTNINGCSTNATVTVNVVTFSASFVTGWNWFSVNTLKSDMTLANVLTTVTSNGDYIKNQVSSATYYTGTGWFGSLTVLDPTKLYKLKIQNNCSISYSGAPVNINSTTIGLVSGWNWIGYLPQAAQPIANGFSSLSLSNLDYVKNQTKSSTYYTASGWFGSLTSLSPGEGYMVKVANPGTLKYPLPGKMYTGISTETSQFSLNPYDYEFNGSITAEVFVDSVTTGSENTFLLAYVNNQLRGVSEGYYFDPRGTYIFPIMIYSNVSDGEMIEFRYYDPGKDSTYRCAETIPFTKDMIVADAFKSFKINASTGQKNITPEDIDGLKLKTYPNPFDHVLNIEYNISENAHVSLTIYNTSGRIIKQLVDEVQKPDNYSVKWYSSAIPGGMYIIKLQAGSRQQITKVTLIR